MGHSIGESMSPNISLAVPEVTVSRWVSCAYPQMTASLRNWNNLLVEA